jgi:hypothetical protein
MVEADAEPLSELLAVVRFELRLRRRQCWRYIRAKG